MTDLNKEREAFEGKFPKPHWIEWDEELGQYTSKHVSDVGYQARFEVWLEAKSQAVPEGYVLVTEDQAKDAARLDFMLQKPRVVISDVNYDENYDKTGEGFCVNEVYWIDGWDRLTETVHQTKREAIDKAMEASESGAEEKEKPHDRS